MFLRRFLTALILLPLVLAAVVYGDLGGTCIMAALAAAIGMREYMNLSPGARGGVEDLLISLWAAVIAAAFVTDHPALPGAALAVGIMGVAMAEAGKGAPTPETLRRVSHTAAGWVLVAFLLGHAVAVRRFGHEPLIFLMVIVMAGDTGAYAVGTLFGKHRLAPLISPKKSVEGAVGGMLGAIVCALVLPPLLKLDHPPAEAVAIAIVINVAAQIGDLAESLFKRAAGVKDSGSIFPGHGGMLDRIDGFLPALPIYAAILSIKWG